VVEFGRSPDGLAGCSVDHRKRAPYRTARADVRRVESEQIQIEAST
jgi:hypothetical protein